MGFCVEVGMVMTFQLKLDCTYLCFLTRSFNVVFAISAVFCLNGLITLVAKQPPKIESVFSNFTWLRLLRLHQAM